MLQQNNHTLDCTVSIVTFNTWNRTTACIDALNGRLKRPAKILVWDNGSPSEVARQRLTKHDNVQVFSQGRNLGFGMGHNQNLSITATKYFVILNPDTTVSDSVLDRLLQQFDNSPHASAVAPMLVLPDGSPQKCVRRLPTVVTEVLRIFYLDQIEGFPGSLFPHRYSCGSGLLVVEQPPGAALVARTNDLRRLGGFDERFPLYFEDVDLCKRLNNFGPILLDTDTVITHDGEGTAKDHRAQTTECIEASRLIYWKKYSPGLVPLMLLIFALSRLSHIFGSLAQAGFSAVRRTPTTSSLAKAEGYLNSFKFGFTSRSSNAAAARLGIER